MRNVTHNGTLYRLVFQRMGRQGGWTVYAGANMIGWVGGTLSTPARTILKYLGL